MWMDFTIGPAGHVWDNATETGDLQSVFFGVKWIQVTTALLSVLGSGSIIGYAVFHNALRCSEIRPLFYLSLSDLLLALCWLLGAIFYKQPPCYNKKSCYNLQTVGEMFYISTFFYTVNYIWQSYLHLRSKLDSNLYKISELECCIRRIATILSSVIPFLFAMPVFVAGNTYSCYENSSHSCLVVNVGSPITTDFNKTGYPPCKGLQTYSITVFLLAFSVSAIPILIIIRRSQTILQKHLATGRVIPEHQWAGIRVLSWSLLVFPAIFVFCRLPAVILSVLKICGHEGPQTFYNSLYFVQALTAVSPGFMNFLAYAGTRRMLRNLKRRALRDVDTQTPLLRSQKKLYASMQSATSAFRPPNASAF